MVIEQDGETGSLPGNSGFLREEERETNHHFRPTRGRPIDDPGKGLEPGKRRENDLGKLYHVGPPSDVNVG